MLTAYLNILVNAVAAVVLAFSCTGWAKKKTLIDFLFFSLSLLYPASAVAACIHLSIFLSISLLFFLFLCIVMYILMYFSLAGEL